MYEEQLLLVERLRRRAKKENQPINRLISKEEVELGECESCALLREQLAKKEVLVSACRTDLEEIKKQMAGYAMIRTQESAEEAELKNKIIAKLQKQLLDARIEVMRLRDQQNEAGQHRLQTGQIEREQELSKRLSLIRKSM